MTYPEIIQFLFVERVRRRIKQGFLAQKAGIAQDTICRAENFRHSRKDLLEEPTVLARTLFKWAEALGYEFELKPIGRENPNEKKESLR